MGAQFNFDLTVICHLYLSVVMGKTKKARWVPPPDPNDFVDPNTRGWHTLTDEGWKPLQPSATLQLPPSFGRHIFTGTIAGWNYEFELTDGQGIQKNVDTMKERDVKWFGSPSPMTDSSSYDPDSNEALFARELELRENELKEERRLRREAEAEVERLRAQLRSTEPPLALDDAESTQPAFRDRYRHLFDDAETHDV